VVHRFTPQRILTAARGETRCGLEFARLIANPALRRPIWDPDAPPVLLIPGLLAGDSSLVVLRTWLRRRGHAVSMSQIRVNADCAERTTARLQTHLRAFAAACGAPVFLIGQSRGGSLARCLAAREPESVCGLVMLGSPVVAPLAASAPVLLALRSVARLGDAGLPGVFSSECADGPCCADFRRDLATPLRPNLRAVAIYSRSDGVVDWRACLDPYAEQIEVESSHGGMAVNSEVYRVLERVLATPEEDRWSG
jgi:pimeloyl-ACP methyl ester carboxylesterase